MEAGSVLKVKVVSMDAIFVAINKRINTNINKGN